MKQYLFLATALLGLAACNETESLSGYDGQVELRFTSGIDVQTRSSHGLDTQLKDGETVHLWIDDSKNRQQTIDQENLYENILLTKEGGVAGTLSGSTPMYFPLTGNDVNIYALHTNATWFGNTYPARSLTHTVAADQRSETDGYATSDLTYAKLTGVPRSGNPTSVAVQFRHLLSKVEVILKKGVGENDFLAGITKVEILNTLPQAKFTLDKEKPAYGKNTELPDGIEITADGTAQNITIDTDITTEGATLILNEAIIVPQTIEAGTAFIKITLAAGGELVYKMKDGGTTFETGHISMHIGQQYIPIDIGKNKIERLPLQGFDSSQTDFNSRYMIQTDIFNGILDGKFINVDSDDGSRPLHTSQNTQYSRTTPHIEHRATGKIRC